MIRRFVRTAAVFSAGAFTAVGALQYAGRKQREERAKQSPVALIRLSGVIAPTDQSGGFASSKFINDQRYGEAFESAFKLPGVQAVALVINSPGGSPTQSSLIYQHLQDLKLRYPNVPLIAFVEDVAASGGYYIACAANEIIADETSMVGSIGVIRSSFGFQELIKTYGIERRVQTAGASKNKLDPFLPETAKDRAFASVLLNTLHENFIHAVQKGRNGRLHPEVAADLARTLDPDAEQVDGLGLFDGSVYVGKAAKDVGLIDDFGEFRTYLRRRFKPTALLEVKPKQDLLKELLSQFGVSDSSANLLASFFGRYSVR